jgi:4'-phosphopantetheinyl transferase
MIWQAAPSRLKLPSNEVHVWRASLDLSEASFEKAKALLAADEHVRAAMFRLDRHRREFMTARATIREILSRYLGCAPANVAFRCANFGKLALAANLEQIRFNLSHSGSFVVCAISREEVGVDIEQERSDLNFEMIAEHVFTACDSTAYRKLPQESNSAAFFRLWTRMEAFIKAIGNGFPDSSLPATLDPEFACQYFRPAPGYAGAVVIRKADWRFCYWHRAFW